MGVKEKLAAAFEEGEWCITRVTEGKIFIYSGERFWVN
jgi:hypothetical protein